MEKNAFNVPPSVDEKKLGAAGYQIRFHTFSHDQWGVCIFKKSNCNICINKPSLCNQLVKQINE